MNTAAPLQNTAAKSPLVSKSSQAGLLLQRKCSCGGSASSSLSGECEECNKKRLQKTLSIGASNDPLEQEADRVAEQVLAAPPNSIVSGSSPRIQRFTGQMVGQSVTAPASVDRVLAGFGRPLELTLRQDMEQRFGHEFSQVRVHSDGAAEQSALDVNANAYTVGSNVVFGAGRYSPWTHEGRRLIAHELTHVVQQSSSDEINFSQSNEKGGLSSILNFEPLTAQGIASSGNGLDELAPPVPKAGECSPGRSESQCFADAGYIITKIRNDCCTRPCTIEHEAHHVKDLDECCKAYHRARKADVANYAAIDKSWVSWLDVARNVSECRAYSDDLICAQRLSILKGCIPETEGNGSSRVVASSNADVSDIPDSVSGEVLGVTAQDTDSNTTASSRLKEQSGCCNDITNYAEMFAPEAKWWCKLAAGRAIPPCPFTSKTKRS